MAKVPYSIYSSMLHRLRDYFTHCISLYGCCRRARVSPTVVAIRNTYHFIRHRQNLLLHPCVKIRGAERISVGKQLRVGLDSIGFMHSSDVSQLNVQGALCVNGNYSIGQGCRIDIGPNGLIQIGNGGYTNANTQMVIMNRLTIGNDTIISWRCQFLDEDFHSIHYEGKRASVAGITIGSHVWIGSGVKIFKGTTIADGCVVAAESIVRGQFNQPNSLIAGHPARVIKHGISWR